MMKKRWLAMLLGLTMAAGSLAACGNNGGAPEASGDNGGSKDANADGGEFLCGFRHMLPQMRK